MKKTFLAVITILALIANGCSSSTKVTSSWKSPDAPQLAAAYNKVMVVALLSDKDRSLQQTMETEMVNQLSSKGISAASAYQTYGPRYAAKSEKQALRMLKIAGADAV